MIATVEPLKWSKFCDALFLSPKQYSGLSLKGHSPNLGSKFNAFNPPSRQRTPLEQNLTGCYCIAFGHSICSLNSGVVLFLRWA